MAFWGIPSTGGGSGGTGYTEEQIQGLIDAAIGALELGLPEPEVRALIESYLADLPAGGGEGGGLTEPEVQTLIDNALAGFESGGGDGGSGGLTTAQVRGIVEESVWGSVDDPTVLPVLDLTAPIRYLNAATGGYVETLPEGAVSFTLEYVNESTDPTYLRLVGPPGVFDINAGNIYAASYSLARGDGLPINVAPRLGSASWNVDAVSLYTGGNNGANYVVQGGDSMGFFNPSFIIEKNPQELTVFAMPRFDIEGAMDEEMSATLYIDIDKSSPVQVPTSPPISSGRSVLSYHPLNGPMWEPQDLREGVMHWDGQSVAPSFGPLKLGQSKFQGFVDEEPGMVLTVRSAGGDRLFEWAPPQTKPVIHHFYVGNLVGERMEGDPDSLYAWSLSTANPSSLIQTVATGDGGFKLDKTPWLPVSYSGAYTHIEFSATADAGAAPGDTYTITVTSTLVNESGTPDPLDNGTETPVMVRKYTLDPFDEGLRTVDFSLPFMAGGGMSTQVKVDVTGPVTLSGVRVHGALTQRTEIYA